MQVPAKWQEVLSKIQGVFPGSIIAGGALRDLEHGKPVKDVDIFCPRKSELLTGDAETEGQILLKKVQEVFEHATLKSIATYGRCDSNFERVIDAVLNVVVDDTVFEIIVMAGENDPVKIISLFDLSLCQIGYDGYLFYRTRAYQDSVFYKTVKVMNINREDRQEKRLQRVAEKYPEYAIERLEDDPCSIPF